MLGKNSGGSMALFLDRDGVLNELVYYKEEGRVGSPLSASQLRASPYSAETVKKIRDLGFKAIVISNQPGVAKMQFSYAELLRMNKKIISELASVGTRLDGEYYCLHHPNALVAKYRKICGCRKPKPGLLIRAAEEHDLNLEKSYFVGDSLIDIKAGRAAGCKTILVGTLTDLLNRVMLEEKVRPDYIVHNISKIPNLLTNISENK
jgi:D-glycero-D-manno-heptose 1,7-bisphosphate phosphatase